MVLSETRPRRTERKTIPTPIVELAPPKTRPIEKKRESKIAKEEKKVAEEEKSTKLVVQPAQEFVYERKRMRILTAKDGKGKIMVGDEFQASVPTFSSKDESKSTPMQVLRYGLPMSKINFSRAASNDQLRPQPSCFCIILIILLAGHSPYHYVHLLP